MSETASEGRLAREAVRLLERYHVEVVERFGLCPWAKGARRTGRTQTRVVLDDPCKPAEVVRALDAPLQTDGDVWFVVVPRFGGGSKRFARWCEAVASSLGDRFFAAPFHPGAEPNASSVRFFRQTPDPTLQLLRRSLIEQLRSQEPAHYCDVFQLELRDLQANQAPKTASASVIEHNERVLARYGRPALQAIFDDIRADRDRSYAASSQLCGRRSPKRSAPRSRQRSDRPSGPSWR